MNRYLTFLAILVIALSSCRPNILSGEGEVVTNTQEVSSFTAVDISVPINATINMQEGAKPSVQLTGHANVLKHIIAKVENNTVTIYCDLDDTWTIDDDEEISAQITLPLLTGLSLSGSPDAEIHGNIIGGNFKLDISGASDVVIDNINVDNFTSVISGAGDIDVKAGKVGTATFKIKGAGDISAFPLQANEVIADISGAGDGEITAVEKLTATIKGAGSIKYKGHPVVSKQVSGVGSVSDAN